MGCLGNYNDVRNEIDRNISIAEENLKPFRYIFSVQYMKKAKVCLQNYSEGYYGRVKPDKLVVLKNRIAKAYRRLNRSELFKIIRKESERIVQEQKILERKSSKDTDNLYSEDLDDLTILNVDGEIMEMRKIHTLDGEECYMITE